MTKRQNQVLAFIKAFTAGNGYPPTVREIAGALGLASPSTAHAHLEGLVKAGRIAHDPTKPRTIRVLP